MQTNFKKAALAAVIMLFLLAGSFLCMPPGSAVKNQCCGQPAGDDIWEYALSRKSDLRLSVYFTAHSIEGRFNSEEGRREVISLLRGNGFTTAYIEVYRSGLTVPGALLEETVSFLKKNGFEVIGAIATVPGGNTGTPQEGTLDWFNWQSPKTQDDMKKIMEDSAPLFDSFIVDDFLCTADTSYLSKSAKGDRSWSEYRRSLLTELSQSVFIQPAKEKNPDIKMIVKYPQWYDRFHLFGYDVAAKSALFDSVWVGTETRGQYTQRFGFVQPYEGFINYRWISTIAGDKTGGAWFDHGDCDDLDFIEQAYQSVLAGARELVIFNFHSYITGHPGHHLLRQDFRKLADLAAAVARSPVRGASAYKPPNSDAGGDLYIMDYIGMFGISLIPESQYPEEASVIFLPTQAAADSMIYDKIVKSLDRNAKIIMTPGFIAKATEGQRLARLAGINWPLGYLRSSFGEIHSEGKAVKLEFPLDMSYQVTPRGAGVLLHAGSNGNFPFLMHNRSKDIFILNTHTFSQEDFDAVGEVLLCPKQIGLLELPKSWVNEIRSAFHATDDPVIDAGSRVTFQQLSDGSFVIHNYNREKTTVNIQLPAEGNYIDGFTGTLIPSESQKLNLEMAPRSRIWCINTIN
jgi:hypothetical protein